MSAQKAHEDSWSKAQEQACEPQAEIVLLTSILYLHWPFGYKQIIPPIQYDTYIIRPVRIDIFYSLIFTVMLKSHPPKCSTYTD